MSLNPSISHSVHAHPEDTKCYMHVNNMPVADIPIHIGKLLHFQVTSATFQAILLSN